MICIPVYCKAIFKKELVKDKVNCLSLNNKIDKIFI